jgi:hypothetical protein
VKIEREAGKTILSNTYFQSYRIDVLGSSSELLDLQLGHLVGALIIVFTTITFSLKFFD